MRKDGCDLMGQWGFVVVLLMAMLPGLALA